MPERKLKEIAVKIKGITKISVDKDDAEKLLTKLLIIETFITIISLSAAFYFGYLYVKPTHFSITDNQTTIQGVRISDCVSACVIRNGTKTCLPTSC